MWINPYPIHDQSRLAKKLEDLFANEEEETAYGLSGSLGLSY